MKKNIFITLLLCTTSFMVAQKKLKVGDNQFQINPSAALHVESKTKGFLPPQMTGNEQGNIPNPAIGLQVYCTDCNPPGLYNFDGVKWVLVGSDTSILLNKTIGPSGAILISGDDSLSKAVNVTGDVLLNSSGVTQIQPSVVTLDKLATVSNNTVLGTTENGVEVQALSSTGTGDVVRAVSPTFTGTPTLPTGTIGVTQVLGDNSTNLATTAFVANAITDVTTSGIPDASTTVKGKIQLAGDLAGTANAPIIKDDAITSAKIVDNGILTADLDDNVVTLAKMSSILGNTILGNPDGTTGLVKEIATTGTGDVVRAVSPTFTGTPVLPTGTTGVTQAAIDNSTKLATTEFVGTAVTNATPDATTSAKGKIQLAGDLAGTAALPTVTNAAVIGKVLTGFASGAGTVSATDSVLGAIQKVDGNVTLKAPLASPTFTGTPVLPTGTTGVTQTAGDSSTKLATTAFVGTAVTNATPDASTTVKGKIQLAGELSGTAALPTVTNAAVIGKVLTGFTSGAGTVSAADTVLGAIQKVDGNVASKAPLASPGLTGLPTVPTAPTGTVSLQIANTLFVATAVANATPDASTIVKGKIQLAGDLEGTAASPKVTNAAVLGKVLTGLTGGSGAILATDTVLEAIQKLNGNSTLKAPLASPTFTGTPYLPQGTTGFTQITGDKSTKLATTEFVGTAITNNAVPYTGATKAVDLGPYDLSVNGLTVGRGNNIDIRNTAIGYSALSSSTEDGKQNTAVGYLTLSSNTVGGLNTAVGASALSSNTTGANNTAVGNKALSSNTEGGNNIGLGFTSGNGLTAGTNNIFIGNSELPTGLTTGNKNVIIGSNITGLPATLEKNIILADGEGTIRAQHDGTTGWDLKGSVTGVTELATDNSTKLASTGFVATALTNNAVPYTGATKEVDLGAFDLKVNGVKVGTGGSNVNSNTAVGASALPNNTEGINNTAVGNYALLANTTGSQNSAFGFRVLSSNKSGNSNTAFGFDALRANATGEQNTAVGISALAANTEGSYNLAVGTNALRANTTGNNNIAFGKNALITNTTAGNNIAVGSDALANNTTGEQNTAVGINALNSNTEGLGNTAFGFFPLTTLTTGSKNIGLGFNSGNGLTTGASNIFIGNLTSSSGLTTGNYNVIIGSSITGLPATLEKNIILADGVGTIRAQHDGTTGWDLKGTVKGVTELAIDNSTKLASTAFVKTAIASNAPYKVWVGLLNQSGTAAPTAIVLHNTTGSTVTFTYSALGIYYMNFTGNPLTVNKVAIFPGSTADGGGAIIVPTLQDTNSIRFVTRTTAGSASNSMMNTVPVEIRIYN